MTLTEAEQIDVRSDALLQIVEAVETAATSDELLLLTLRKCIQLLDLPYGAVLLLNDERTEGTLACEFPPRVKTPPPIVLAEAPQICEVITSRQPLQIRDMRTERAMEGLVDTLQIERVRSLLLLPLIAQDSVLGVLMLATIDAPRPISPSMLALARVMASQFASSIAAFRITEAAQRRSTELLTLNEIAATVTSSLDPHEVYRLVQKKLNEHFNVEAGSLLMIDEESGELEFVMRLEGGEEHLSGMRVPKGQGIAGLVAQTQRYEIVLDAQDDPRIYRRVSEALGTVTRSLLCAPLVVKGRSIGVVQLLNKRDGVFTDEDGERLTRMAKTIGVAIENARLFQQVTTGRDRSEAILNSTTDGILMADMHGVVVTANPMAARIFGLRRASMVGVQLDELLAALYANAHEHTPARHADAGSAISVVELELLGANRPIRFVRHFSLPVRDANGAEIGKLMLLQDTTQEKELEELRDDYTGMLVHDLRAPLTSIMNGVLMVGRGLGGPVTDRQRELLNIAHQGSQTMLSMVNTLLDIAKMEENRMQLDHELISPYSMIEEAEGRLRVSVQGQNVRLIEAFASDLPNIKVDRDKITRVLQNLIDNAIKFSPVGRSITLGGALVCQPGDDCVATLPIQMPPLAEGRWLVLWVSDEGPGIPAQYHERVFEKFGQVRGRKVRGTGLGLTFCKLAVEAHDGTIWLESNEGKGSTFAFALPMDRTPQPQKG